jgi:hypothetical protein
LEKRIVKVKVALNRPPGATLNIARVEQWSLLHVEATTARLGLVVKDERNAPTSFLAALHIPYSCDARIPSNKKPARLTNGSVPMASFVCSGWLASQPE